MKRSWCFLPLFMCSIWSCGTRDRSESSSQLASVSLSGLEGMDASRARLTVRPLTGEAKVLSLSAPQFAVPEAFAPGEYTFSLEIFGVDSIGLIASTGIAPCSDIKATLKSGPNPISIPVCNAKGLVLNPSPKADVSLTVIPIDRALFRDYQLACRNAEGGSLEAATYDSQSVLSSLSALPFAAAESSVEAGIHTLKARNGSGELEVKAQVNTAAKTLESVQVMHRSANGSLQELRFSGWECELRARAAAEPLPPGYASWDAINEVNPESAARLIYDGIDPVAESFGDDARCSVYLMASYQDGQTTLHILRSSFAHGGHSHPFVTIRDESPQSLTLSGKSRRGQDEMKLTLKQAGDFSSLTAAKIRWLHDDHYHSDTCERLIPRRS